MNSTTQKKWKRKRLVMIPLFIIGLFSVSGLVMLIWNFAIASLFALPIIDLWRAMALFVLCRILFGSFPIKKPGRNMPPFANEMFKEKLMNMNDEEKKEFKEQWRKRFNR